MKNLHRKGIQGTAAILPIILMVMSSTILLIPQSQAESGGDPILIETPEFISVRDPFMVHIRLNLSGDYHIKASLNSIHGKSASRLWNGTDWLYPGTSWSKMPAVEGNFSGFLYLMPYPDYSGWKQLGESDTAFLNVTVQKLNSSEQERASVPVRLLDYGATAGVHGYSISGTVYYSNSPLECGFVCLKDRDNPAGNHTLLNLTAFYTTERNWVTEDGNGKGHYHLWAPAGNYTLSVYSDTGMRGLLYSENLTLNSNLTLNLGNYTLPWGVVINEVLYNPAGNETEGEFVELYNALNRSVNLTGWTLSDQDGDGVDFTFPAFVLPSHGFVVLHTGKGTDYTAEGVQHFYLGKSSSFLSNTGDDLLLSDADGKGVDYIAWGTGSAIDPPPEGTDWEGVMTAEEGHSLSLIPDGADWNSTVNWQETLPTPGAPNTPMSWESYTPFISPDSALEAVRKTIQGAEEEIDIVAYSVSNYVLIEEVEKALDRGVKVRAILQPEHPIRIFDNHTLYAAANWSRLGAEVRENTGVGEGSLMLVDGRTGVFYTSNWSLMTLNIYGNYGKRAWGILFENKSAVETLEERFEQEWNGSKEFQINGNGTPPNDFGSGDYSRPFKELISFSYGGTEPLYFPEDEERFFDALKGAGERVCIETDRLLEKESPRISAELINLSKKGVRVEVVLSESGAGRDKSLIKSLEEAGAEVRVNTEFGLNTRNAGMDGTLIIADNFTILLPGLVPTLNAASMGLVVKGEPVRRFSAFFDRDFWNSTDYRFAFTPYHPLITEVYYNTYAHGDDEYLCIYNQASTMVNLTGWTLTDGEGIYTLPSLSLSPGKKAYFARNTTIFLHLTGIHTSLTFPLSLGNEKDSLSIINTAGSTVDAVAWGGERLESGWEGELPSVGKGQVIRRKREGGLYCDTNGPEDWESLRIYMVGQSDFPFEHLNFSGNVTVFVSPDSSFGAIHSELQNASKSIHLNVYEFTNYRLMDDLLSALNRSVEVSVLLEGGPVGGVPEEELYLAKTLTESGATVRFLNSNRTFVEPWLSDYIHDRYNYDHAKYAVIDGSTLILDSENWKDTGIPVDPGYGNRGWGIIVRNREVAQYFERVFENDSNPVFYDVARYGEGPYIFKSTERPVYELLDGNYHPEFPATTISGDFEVTPVLAPDHTLRDDAIIGMIDSAKKSVYIEQLQCYISWAEGLPNLYIEAAIRAAQRGCDVRILLDSRYVNTADKKLDNADTVDYINNRAKALELDNLKAKLIVLRGLDKVHNKGVIVDGNLTLISSINWGKGAVLLNREAGVIVRNREVAQYYTAVFLYDWSLSESKEETNLKIEPAYLISAVVIIAGVLAGLFFRWKRLKP